MLPEYHKFLDKKNDKEIKSWIILLVAISVVVTIALSFFYINLVTPTIGAACSVMLFGALEAWWYRFAPNSFKERFAFVDRFSPVNRILFLIACAIVWVIIFVPILPFIPQAAAGVLNLFVFIILIFAGMRGPRITESDLEEFKNSFTRPSRRRKNKIEKTVEEE